jgi:hypothetical protein
MKPLQRSIIKAISIAVVSIVIMASIGYLIFPQYLFVIPGYELYTSGIVDHKKIGQLYNNGQQVEVYTASIRLFEDDPINNVKSGETLAYSVPKNQWNMLEQGDTVKIRLLTELKAEIAELFPSVKPPEWSINRLSGLDIKLSPDKPTYKTGETAIFNVKVKNENSAPLQITIFESANFWIFENGKTITSKSEDYATGQIALEPNKEYSFSFQWTASQPIQENSSLIYYIRAYIGYFTLNPEITLIATSIITVEN